jgi:hypothetical protein
MKLQRPYQEIAEIACRISVTSLWGEREASGLRPLFNLVRIFSIGASGLASEQGSTAEETTPVPRPLSGSFLRKPIYLRSDCPTHRYHPRSALWT